MNSEYNGLNNGTDFFLKKVKILRTIRKRDKTWELSSTNLDKESY